MKKYCLALDLKDDPALIEEYERLHKPENTRPEIMKSIADSGITVMEIYRLGTRLFMIIEAADDFSFEKKSAMDASNPKVQDGRILFGIFSSHFPGPNREKSGF
jgi:L-rhamnose mutarotase